MSIITTLFTMPVIFFGHGGPMNVIEKNKYTKSWVEIVKNFSKTQGNNCNFCSRETNDIKVTNNKIQKTIYDFHGFPEKLYKIEYNQKGDQELGEKITKLILESRLDDSWSLDHRTWSILTHIYPKANIPLIQISIDKNKTLKEHCELARKLRSFRDEGVLIIESRNIVHNLGAIKWNENQDPHPWAINFNSEIKFPILNNDIEKILNYKNIKGAKDSVPNPEHFIPLIYILGLKNNNEKALFFVEGFEMGSLSMDSFIVRQI